MAVTTGATMLKISPFLTVCFFAVLGDLPDRTDTAEHTGALSGTALPVDWSARRGAHDLGPGCHVRNDVVAITEPARGDDQWRSMKVSVP
jgi:hypothetical protein